jgi:hypothetical protein
MPDPLKPLTRCNRRQKSDVAQKFVSMCLHELSAALVRERPDLRVETAAYVEAVRAVFGVACAFCAWPLAADTHVEHLDAMNRLRAGLHIAGNVVLACKRTPNAAWWSVTELIPRLLGAPVFKPLSGPGASRLR